MLLSAVVDASCVCSPLQKVAARPSVEVCAEMFFFSFITSTIGSNYGEIRLLYDDVGTRCCVFFSE